jgi:PAS domain S-box-containing protein
LRTLLDISPLPMFVGTAGRDLRLVAVNQRFTALFGYARADLHGVDSWWSLAFPDPGERREHRRAWRTAVARAKRFGIGPPEPLDARVTCRDHSVRHVEFYLGLHAGCVFVLCKDVTAQRRAEVERSEARAFLQRVVDTSPSMIFVVDERGRLEFANRSLAAYYGTTPEALLDRATEDVHADETQAKTYVQDDIEVIQLGKEIVKEELNTAPDGREHWFQTVKVPLLLPDGRVRCLGISTDVTARKRAEEARLALEARAWQSQKLESLGVLAGGIAHDFNNLLTSIRTNTALADARLPTDSPARPFVTGIERATQQAAQLTQQMLAYVGCGQALLETVHLDAIVGEMIALLEAVVSKKASFRLELAPAVVEADTAQMRQVIMNLITNSADSLGEHAGQIVVRTGTREVEREALVSPFIEDTPQAGSFAFLEVEDDGCGMSRATLERMFEPFYSTKFTGRGLGLSAVLGIVRAHRGTIQVESHPEHGSLFRVLLPDTSGEPVNLRGPASVDRERARGTLLVIDDDNLIRTTVCVMLEDAGFRVLSAEDGLAGLEAFQRHAEVIDTVLLDLTMPRLDGWQCLRRLRAIRADVPVVLMTGYAANASIPADVTPAPAILQKPFEPEDLLEFAARSVSASPRLKRA